MDSTHRLNLPTILPGQAQKEITHNEALQIIDVLLAGAVEEPPSASPPASPTPGKCFIVGQNPSGEWTGMASHVAAYTAAGWRFIAPVEGMCLYVRSEQVTALYRNSAWEIGRVRGSSLTIGGNQVVGPRAAGIADPSGGAVADTEARAAITAILAALRTHGLIAQ